MDIWLFKKIAKSKISLLFILILTGLIYGTLITYLVTNYSNTISLALSAVIAGPFIIIIAGSLKRFLLTVLVVCLPVTVDMTIGQTAHLGGAAGYIISLYDIVLFMLYFLWLSQIAAKKEPKFYFSSAINTSALSFMFVATFSMVFASSPDLSKYEIIEIIKMYLTFIYLANNIKTEKDVQFIVTLFILSLFFEGFLGIAQRRYGNPFWPTALGGPHRIMNDRVSGTWVSTNDFSWYLTYLIPIAMSVLFAKTNYIYKYLCGATIIVGLASLIYSKSRAGWISIIVAGIFVGIFIFTKIKGKKSLINTFFAIIALIIFVSPIYPRLFHRVYQRFTGNDRGSAESRLPQFQVAFNIIRAHPLIGIGINNYTEVMHDYDNTEEGLDEITKYPVHNILLQITAEMGIFGLLTFVWFIISIYYVGIKFVTTNESIGVYLVIGMMAGIMAFIIHGLVDTASVGNKLFIFIWFFAGIIAAVRNMHAET